jgi:hypothetical protein
MAHNTAVIARLTNVRKHSNADRLNCATVLGNQVVVGLDHTEGELGVYFDSNLQLSEEFAKANDLIRRKDPDGKQAGGMFDFNRRVRTQKFRGEISDGFWIPLKSLDFIPNKPNLNEGDEFVEINSIPICNKYIIQYTQSGMANAKKTKTAKTSVMFKEHFSTEHFGKHLTQIQHNERIVITEKLHGTSGRIANVLVEKDLNPFLKLLSYFLPIEKTEWRYLNGTRRVVLEETTGKQFHDPTIREIALKMFKGDLHKGETVYFEIVGYETTGATIMPSVDIKKMNDKEFLSRWRRNNGTTDMVYSYGCEPGTCRVYVYRITTTDIDGNSVDLSWEDVKKRCDELGVKYVPEITALTMNELVLRDKLNGGNGDIRNAREMLMQEVELYSKGSSILDPSHIREGVCIRLDNYGRIPIIYKHKSFEFKVLEGIIKDSGIVDTEDLS